MSEPLIVAIPTHDLRAVVPSLLELSSVGRFLQRPIRFTLGEASNIPRARNVVLQQLSETYQDSANPWVFWLDSDIVIFPGSAEAIATAIEWAQSHDRGIVANYRMANGQNVLMVNRQGPPYHHYTDEEFAALPEYAPGGLAGLGLAYFRQPLDYVFHADDIGEDIHLWWDHPELTMHLAKQIHVGHQKVVVLQ